MNSGVERCYWWVKTELAKGQEVWSELKDCGVEHSGG